jgi:regulator of sirC expression with transglutaminase-like and TPR domain
MLRNLKGAYIERDDFEHAFTAADRALLIEPESTQDIRDRGLLHGRLGHIHQALEDFETYARMSPNASDLGTIRHHARKLVEQLGRST